jgi:DNA-binding MltR family transcriptional regulator
MLLNGPGLKELDKDTGGPLSTFSARINLAHALRIIDDAEYRDLHIIRRIRNDFAHRRDCDFETETVRNRIRDLSKSEKQDSPAEALERVAMFLIMHLEAAIAGLADYELPVPQRVFGPDAD